MQVTEKSQGKSQSGLARTFGVTVEASELDARLEARIAELTPTLRLKGFRPGKVPPAHVRRIFGKSLMGEVVEKTLSETSQQVLADNGLRVASQPDLAPTSDMAQVIAGKEDLAYEISVEVMPEFEPAEVEALAFERPVYTPSEEEVAAELASIVAQNRTFEPRKGKAVKAAKGDQLLIDFAGTIEGKPFEGGSAEGAEIVLGDGRFIPGFEEELLAAAPGDQVMIHLTFPDDYAVARLKGQAAEFVVQVKEVRAPKQAKADDALAERLGLTDLAALKAAIRHDLEHHFEHHSRHKLKRALLDALDSGHDIALPAKMVEGEFSGIWSQLEADKEKGEVAPEDEGKSEEELRSEYRAIAERRVRLGLVLAEIGRRAGIEVSEEELSEAMREEARRYGPQAQQIFDLLKNNPTAQAQIRAPLYEEKVVDHILSRSKVSDRQVSKEELLREDELPEAYGAPKAKAASKAKKAPKAAKDSAKAAKAPAAKADETAPAEAQSKAAKPATSEKTAKPAAEKTSKPAAAKTAAKTKAAKPAPKAAGQPSAKSSPKPAPKTAAKSSVKPTPRSGIKPGAKSG